jgi:hypothetical protein
LISNSLFESRFEEFARDFALAKTWQVSPGSDFAVGFAEVAVYFSAGHRHDDVPLASGRFIDFDLDI